MSDLASHPAPALSAEPLAMPAKARFAAFLTAIGAIVLIGSEIWLAAFGTLWAVHGFFDLATVGDIIFIVLIAPLAIWATWMVAKLAISAEMNPDNAD